MSADLQSDDWRTRLADAQVPGGFLAAFVIAARAAELEPFRRLRQAGLPTQDLDRASVSHARFLELLHEAERDARRPDFVLMVVREFTLATMGPVGVLASVQSTVGAALSVLCHYSADGRRRMRAALERDGAEASLRYYLRGESPARAPRSAELAVGLAYRALQSLAGPDWRARRVTLTCTAPDDAAPYEALFGEVSFAQPFDAIAFDAADLDRPLPSADPELARAAAAYLAKVAPVAQVRFADEVREIIAALLPHGACSADEVAARLGVDRRTVHRRLAEAGVTFSDLLQAVRQEAARAGMAKGDPAATLARALGLSGPSAFSRWFRQTYGAPPSRYHGPG